MVLILLWKINCYNAICKKVSAVKQCKKVSAVKQQSFSQPLVHRERERDRQTEREREREGSTCACARVCDPHAILEQIVWPSCGLKMLTMASQTVLHVPLLVNLQWFTGA